MLSLKGGLQNWGSIERCFLGYLLFPLKIGIIMEASFLVSCEKN